jgi:predicted nucleic acid-binding protein
VGRLTTLVDTSVLIAAGRLSEVELEGGWAVSAISIGELDAGVLLARKPHRRASRLRLLTAVLSEAPILDIDRAVAARYGELRAATGRVPTNDLWIAAIALAHDLTLLTADERQAALPMVCTTLVG